MKKYPAVVIGCGFIGSAFNETPSYDPHHTHAAGYAAHASTDLSAVCDIDEKRAKESAKHWKTEFYTDAEKMLAEKNPVFVSIASPTETHTAMLNLALETPSVKAILCEKPIADNIDESIKLVEKAKKKNIHLAVNYSRRFNAGHNKVKDLITAAALGDLKIVRTIYQKGILHNGTHMIDLFRFLIGEIVAVDAVKNPAARAGDSLSGTLEFAGGLKACISGADMTEASFSEVDIIGTKGRVITSQNGHVVTHYGLVPNPLFPTYKTFGDGRNISDGLIDNTYNAIQDLVDCLEGKRKNPRCTGDDAVRAMKIAYALVESAQRGERIEVR